MDQQSSKKDFQDIKEDYDVICKLEDHIVEALALGLKEPIKYDYPLPSAYHLTRSTVLGVSDYCGSDDLSKKRSYQNLWRISWNSLKKPEMILPRLKIGLDSLFEVADRDSESHLSILMSSNESFGSEWFFGLGTLYRFRPHLKEEFEYNFDNFWDDEEKKQFNELYPLINKYIKNYYQDKY